MSLRNSATGEGWEKRSDRDCLQWRPPPQATSRSSSSPQSERSESVWLASGSLTNDFVEKSDYSGRSLVFSRLLSTTTR